ncbi:MAG TPA: branched-chain amino acid aminotransferase [Acetobacteraceae bacterium]|jgi:branched-chain amino acid aminotransferase|nr:branched-chain amino acid aminotransferase [Acetobacteraceae bacterium]
MELVPFDDRDGWIWWDGKLVPWRDAKLHVLTHGLHYASAVFEGERAYNGHIFRLRDHTNRLINSGRILGFEIPFSAEAIDAACREVLAANNLTEGYVRPIAWRGTEMLAVSAQHTKIHLAIAAWPWPSYFGDARMQGIRLGMAEWKRPSPETAPTAAKATGLYMIGTMSKHKVEEQGWNDALMLDWRGRVSESTGANIFFVMDGALHTPTPDGFLDGITRRSVMSLARARQMIVVERPIELEEIAGATECFLAGTAAEVTAVREIAGRNYTPGQITETLMRDYDALVMQSPEAVAKVVAA